MREFTPKIRENPGRGQWAYKNIEAAHDVRKTGFHHMRRVAALVLLATVLGGCVSAPISSPSETPPISVQAIRPQTHVVVAVVDSGIQPYHDVFRAPIDWTPPALAGAITLGDDFRERALNDANAWNDLEVGQLYYFAGTRVFAISHHPQNDPLNRNPHIIFDDIGTTGHGTGTASIVAQTSPYATIIMVEASANFIRDAFAWISTQPAIDLASLSQNRVINNMADPTEHPDPVAANEKTIVDQGRLVITAAGNDPSLTIMGSGGPPWVICVGGAEQRSHGESIITSKLPDVVANTTSDRLARSDDLHAYELGSGTSYGTPMVAGVLAEALYRLREKLGDIGVHSESGPLVNSSSLKITNAQLRAALNATAVYWNASEYEPTENPYSDPRVKVITTTAPILPVVAGTPVGPWIQMGWGYVGPELIPQLVAILSGEAQVPLKREAAEYMARVWSVKAAFWDAWQTPVT